MKIIDRVNINELGIRAKLEDEIRRFNKLQKIVNGQTGKALVEENDVNIRQYAKYLLKEGSVSDKRELLANLRSRLLSLKNSPKQKQQNKFCCFCSTSSAFPPSLKLRTGKRVALRPQLYGNTPIT